jgi:hypothetical protein
MIIPFVRPAAPDAGKTAHRHNAATSASDSEPVPLVGHSDPWAWLLAASLKIDLWKLAQFNELMAAHRQTVHLGRMFRDPAYAFERLSEAHASGNNDLMTLSLEMFEQYLQLERRRRSSDAAANPFAQH